MQSPFGTGTAIQRVPVLGLRLFADDLPHEDAWDVVSSTRRRALAAEDSELRDMADEAHQILERHMFNSVPQRLRNMTAP